jgi:hypothetical protein
VTETAAVCPAGFTISVSYISSTFVKRTGVPTPVAGATTTFTIITQTPTPTPVYLAEGFSGTSNDGSASAFFLVSDSSDDIAGIFGIDPSNQGLCTSYAAGVALYAEEYGAGPIEFDNRSNDNDETPVLATLNSDNSINLFDVDGHPIYPLICDNVLSWEGDPDFCSAVELFAVPTPSAPTTTIVRSVTSTTTATPAPTCASFIMQVVGSGSSLDGKYVTMGDGSLIVSTSTSPPKFFLDASGHLGKGSYFADVNSASTTGYVDFDSLAPSSTRSFLTCNNSSNILNCTAGTSSVFQISPGGTVARLLPTLLTGNTAIQFQTICQDQVSSAPTTPPVTTSPASTCPIAQVVANPGFETGDLSNWTVQQLGSQTSEVDQQPGETYEYAIYSSGVVQNTLSQVVNTTAGANYTVSMSYRFASVNGNGGQSIQLAAGGKNITVVAGSSTAWQGTSFNVTAPASNMTVQVISNMGANASIYIDNVMVVGPSCSG